MIITCEKCNSSFNLKESLVKPAGSKVRCSKCKHIFIAYPPETTPGEEPDAIEPVIPESPLASPAAEAPKAAARPTDMEPPFEKAEEEDLQLEMAFDSFTEERAPQEAPPEEEELELDLDFDTHDDDAPSPGEKSQTKAEDRADSLDFSDIGKMIEDESRISGAEETDGEPELSLSMEKDAPSPEDELNFSDIGDIIDKEGDAGERSDDEEMDLDLSLADEESLSATEAQDEDLDFSELEKILEEDDLGADDASKEDIDLDLDLELSSDEEKEEELVLEMEKPKEEDEDLDFSDIEHMLESEEEEVGDAVPELVMEPKKEEVALPKEPAEEDFELSFEDDEPGEKIEADDADTPVSEETADLMADIDRDDDHSAPIHQEEDTPFHETADEEMEEESFDEPPFKEHKKTSPALIVLLVLLLIGGGGYAAVTFLGMDITKIKELLNISSLLNGGGKEETGVIDPGYLKITTHDVRSKFIDNNKGGRLFVITGEVTNEYPNQRSFISLTGKLYAKEKVLAKTENIFAGNFLSDIDLTQMDLASVYQRLQNKNGDNNINKGVKPMGNIPFMIVFSDLPEDLAEFTIEVTGSVAE